MSTPASLHRRSNKQLEHPVFRSQCPTCSLFRSRLHGARPARGAATVLPSVICASSPDYGVLKPFDLMQPYRLEMGLKWAITPN